MREERNNVEEECKEGGSMRGRVGGRKDSARCREFDVDFGRSENKDLWTLKARVLVELTFFE